MPANCFYYPSEIQKEDMIQLSKEEAFHATKVMRVREGEKVTIFNGMGSKALGVVLSIKPQLQISIQDLCFKDYKETFSIAQAITIPAKMEWIVEKLTELDVDHLYFFPSQNSDKKQISDHQKTRLEKMIIQALKQSGRSYLPKLHFFTSLTQIPSKHTFFFGNWKEQANSKLQICKNPCFINGPEKGLSEKEIETICKNWNAQGICFSSNTLRTETAAIAAGCYFSLCLHNNP